MGHNNKGMGAAWYLDSCELENVKTGACVGRSFCCGWCAVFALQSILRAIRSYLVMKHGTSHADGHVMVHVYCCALCH